MSNRPKDKAAMSSRSRKRRGRGRGYGRKEPAAAMGVQQRDTMNIKVGIMEDGYPDSN